MAGNVMDQNANGTSGEIGDAFSGSTVLVTPVVRKPSSFDHGVPATDGGRTISTSSSANTSGSPT